MFFCSNYTLFLQLTCMRFKLIDRQRQHFSVIYRNFEKWWLPADKTTPLMFTDMTTDFWTLAERMYYRCLCTFRRAIIKERILMLVKISYRTSLCHIVPNENMQYSNTKYTQFKNKMGNINVSKKYLLIKNIVLHSKKNGIWVSVSKLMIVSLVTSWYRRKQIWFYHPPKVKGSLST